MLTLRCSVTDAQTKYCNPRCACAPRVNYDQKCWHLRIFCCVSFFKSGEGQCELASPSVRSEEHYWTRSSFCTEVGKGQCQCDLWFDWSNHQLVDSSIDDLIGGFCWGAQPGSLLTSHLWTIKCLSFGSHFQLTVNSNTWGEKPATFLGKAKHVLT